MNITQYINITMNQSITRRLSPDCFCIYPDYNNLILLNIIFSLVFLFNTMFRPFEKKQFRNKYLDTDALNIYTFVMFFTINIYFLVLHFMFENIAYFLGYM